MKVLEACGREEITPGSYILSSSSFMHAALPLGEELWCAGASPRAFMAQSNGDIPWEMPNANECGFVTIVPHCHHSQPAEKWLSYSDYMFS